VDKSICEGQGGDRGFRSRLPLHLRLTPFSGQSWDKVASWVGVERRSSNSFGVREMNSAIRYGELRSPPERPVKLPFQRRHRRGSRILDTTQMSRAIRERTIGHSGSQTATGGMTTCLSTRTIQEGAGTDPARGVPLGWEFESLPRSKLETPIVCAWESPIPPSVRT